MRIVIMALWGIVAAALFAGSVQANTFQRADIERFLSLEKKIASVMQDLTDAMEPVYQMQDYRTLNCLNFIHTQATHVGSMWATVGILTGLAGAMKDNDDEIVVLDQLRRSLTRFSGQLASSRKLINQEMAVCSSISPTVSVKGQAVLNVLSELTDAAERLTMKAGK